MVPEGPPRGSYCASWLRLSLYHNKVPCSLNIMKSYRIEGHRLPMFTFNQVANINIGGQSGQRRVSAATPPLASSHAPCRAGYYCDFVNRMVPKPRRAP